MWVCFFHGCLQYLCAFVFLYFCVFVFLYSPFLCKGFEFSPFLYDPFDDVPFKTGEACLGLDKSKTLGSEMLQQTNWPGLLRVFQLVLGPHFLRSWRHPCPLVCRRHAVSRATPHGGFQQGVCLSQGVPYPWGSRPLFFQQPPGRLRTSPPPPGGVIAITE